MFLYDAYVHIAQRSCCLLDDDDDRITQQQLYVYATFVERILTSIRIRTLRSTYARIRVIVVCYETRYLTPCAQPSSTWGRFHWRRSLIVYARYVCGDAPLVPSEQREYYRRRRRTSSFTSQILLRKAAACLFLRVGSYTILNRLCSKARAIFKT